ncbi:MAG: RNA methyltransferase [Bacteroidales bacterium]|jgi:TrmH family RNA methyltransferase|nr:RNA methyltransferase [Bacteroidales bacterium]
MLSKNKIKFINSIKKKKYRDAHGLFFVEGEKLVDELLQSEAKISTIYATQDWIEQYQQIIDRKKVKPCLVSNDELKKISALSTPNRVLATVSIPQNHYNKTDIARQLSLLLDQVSDPGNLGTIIRIADWFGIQNIFCTPDSVDLYNPKVVQATMGAIFRVKVHYADFRDLLKDFSEYQDFPIYGTFLEGENIYQHPLNNKGFIIMGNESRGISPQWESFIKQKLFIPNYPAPEKSSESLNLSAATAIVCSEFRRRPWSSIQNGRRP